ncbi:HTH-type transcriptional regulator DmlR [Methylophilaceae bacterium]|nr:HTH-type transcriptional regulator DmlR [Methylophilaceae bacterium]
MLNRLEMMRIFCVAAESASFKDAAVRLGVSPQAVTRAIKELENTVGEPLFYRNTRHMRITDFGEQLAFRAKDSIAGIDDLFRRSDQQPEAGVTGIVRITAPTVIGRHFLLDVLSDINLQYPHITLDLRLSDSITDVIEQQIDIGVRVGFLRDSSFVARAAAKITFLSVAAPSLIARVGLPEDIQALAELPTVGLVDNSSGRIWPWYLGEAQQIVPRNRVFLTDDPETELQMVLKGAGFGQIADCLVLPYIREGRLVSLLPEYTPPPWDIYVYRPQRGPVPARIRVVYDRILERLLKL